MALQAHVIGLEKPPQNDGEQQHREKPRYAKLRTTRLAFLLVAFITPNTRQHVLSTTTSSDTTCIVDTMIKCTAGNQLESVVMGCGVPPPVPCLSPWPAIVAPVAVVAVKNA